MKIRKSIIRKLLTTTGIALTGIIAVLFAFLLVSAGRARREVLQISESYLQGAGAAVDRKIENLDRLGRNLLYKNEQYEILRSGNANERYYALHNIREDVLEHTAFVDEVDFTAVAEEEYGQHVFVERDHLKGPEREQLLKLVTDACESGTGTSGWCSARVGERIFFYRIYVWQNCGTGIFTSAETLFADLLASVPGNLGISVEDSAGARVLSISENGLAAAGETEAEPIDYKHNAFYNLPGIRYETAEGAFALYARILSLGTNFLQAGTLMLLFLILAALAAALVLRRQIREYVRKPMETIQRNMNQIRSGDLSVRITEDFGSTEFEDLKGTFNHLMDEVTNLKIESYEKQIELSEKQIELAENELRSVRLQLRPHFFLNALTTISSLSMKQRNEEIRTYIDALSKNVRYMFRSGLHTVPLSDELRHVENYFEMQELKYPGCVFYFIEQEHGTQNWPIPQMILHTIIENEYKYAVSVDRVLTILIQTARVERNGEEFLKITVEDDGQGYPEEFLSGFAASKAGIRVNGERVGLYSIRRMLELMYEKEDLFRISNIEPHGCRNRLLIPAKPVHEIAAELEN